MAAPSYSQDRDDGHFYHVTPDEVDVLVDELSAMNTPDLDIRTFPQHSGRKVHALTFSKPERGNAEKQRLFISRPHAHEPAGTAACTELAKTLAGYGAYADRNAAWGQWALENFVITIVPDVVEEIISQSVESDALHESRRDDPVRIDIMSRNKNSAP
jgi:hypothetical protein